MTVELRQSANIDRETVDGFGEEWSAFDQDDLPAEEQARLFEAYFSTFPWDALDANSEGFDLGCGSGRWAVLVAPRVGKLHCIDPAAKALEVSRQRLAGMGNVEFHEAASDTIPLADSSQDFGYSLGVLHHIPDTGQALKDAVRKLKPGAPFLLYLIMILKIGRPGFDGCGKRASSAAAQFLACRSAHARQ